MVSRGGFFMIKKIIGAGIVMVMIFSLAGCGIVRHKENAKAELTNFVKRNDYTAENWSIIEGLIEEGKTAIDEARNKSDVDSALNEARNAIGMIFSKEEEMADFVVRISVEKATWLQGEGFNIDIKLKNQSGENVEITYVDSVVWLYMDGFCHPLEYWIRPNITKSLTVKKTDIFSRQGKTKHLDALCLNIGGD
jgi:hypothetical protein